MFSVHVAETGTDRHRVVVNAKPVTILLVDDDEVDAHAVERGFKQLRIANPIVRARDGIEALRLLRARPEESGIESPFIVLLDINLPRKSGIEVLAELRADAELRRTVVFVMTTSRADEDRLAAYDLNVAGYLVKNQLPEAFLASLQMLDRYWNVVMLP